MKTPWQYAETGNEFSHQVALFMWANMAAQFGLTAANNPISYQESGVAQRYAMVANDLIPELQWLHAIKNAGHGDAIRGARSAAEGVKAGVPDIFLPTWREMDDDPRLIYCGLYIELKRPLGIGKKPGVVSADQIRWNEHLQDAGYAVETCYGWEQARNVILGYLGRG